MTRTLAVLFALPLVAACSGGSPASPNTPSPGQPTGAPEPLPFDGEVCAQPAQLVAWAPMPGAPSGEQLQVTPPERLGLLVAGKPFEASSVARYGYVVEWPGEWIDWWAEPEADSLASFVEWVKPHLASGCEGFGSDGHIQISARRISTGDARLVFADGTRIVGSGWAEAKQRFPGGDEEPNQLSGGLFWTTRDVTLGSNEAGDRVSGISIALP